ncbi:hypothetical protein KBC89_02480 [Candidatus Woesebacteria bacterium]|nr:hypothetical protein [Candidatus Woesebacteria bacterium]
MAEVVPSHTDSDPFQYRPRDLQVIAQMIADGSSFSVIVGSNLQVEDLVTRISNQLSHLEAAQPTVLSLDSPTLRADIARVVDVAMSSYGSPSRYKQQHSEYYIWVNADHILNAGLAAELSRISKYTRCIFIFDHPYDFSLLPDPLKYALGAEVDRNVILNPTE